MAAKLLCRSPYTWADLQVVNRSDWLQFRFIFGERTDGKAPVLRFLLLQGPIEDLMRHGPMLLVSDRFRQALAPFATPESVEFIPVEVADRTSWRRFSPRSWHPFWILNVLATCDCIDFENSRCKFLFDEVSYIDELVLDHTRISTEPFFLLGRCGIQLICVREDVIAELTRCGVSGVQFIPPEDFTSRFTFLE